MSFVNTTDQAVDPPNASPGRHVAFSKSDGFYEIGSTGPATPMGAAAVTAHVAQPDPHTQYQLESEKGNANGYASLDGTGKVPLGQLPGVPPSGPAGGDLTGTYPSPLVVVASETVAGKIEIATQAETDTGTDDLRAITPLKLATTPRLPAQDENDALQGTNGTPSNANRYVTDSDPRNTDARTPTAHAVSHQHGGGDEVATATPAANAIPKAGGAGTLAPGWLPAATEAAQGAAEIATQAETDTGTDDARFVTPLKLATTPRLPSQAENDALQGTNGAPSNTNRYVTDSDPRNTNARTPTSHASTHQHGGGDEVATATPAANAIPKAGGGGEVAAGWLPTMVGATSSSPGTKGAVPQPAAGDQEKFLQGNGTWKRLRTHPDSSFGTDLYMLGSPLDYYNTGSPQAANEVQYTRVWLEVGQVITGARTFITSGANGVRQVTMALFDQATPTSNSGAPNNRVATTGPTTPANAFTGYYSASFSVAYTVTATGFYWVAIQTDSGTLAFAITDAYPADFLPRREEAPGSFTMPATAGTLTNPSSAAIFCAAVE